MYENWTHFSSSSSVASRRDNNTKSNFHMMPSELTPPPPLSSHPVPPWRKNFHFMSTFSALLCIFLSDICVFHMAEREKRRRCGAHERREKRGKKPGAKFPFFPTLTLTIPPLTAAFLQYISRRGGVFPICFLGLFFPFSNDERSAQKSVSKRSDKVFFLRCCWCCRAANEKFSQYTEKMRKEVWEMRGKWKEIFQIFSYSLQDVKDAVISWKLRVWWCGTEENSKKNLTWDEMNIECKMLSAKSYWIWWTLFSPPHSREASSSWLENELDSSQAGNLNNTFRERWSRW